MNKRTPLIIKGADEPIEIAPGDWYQNPKAHPKRLMKISALSSVARQVYECIELASMAYQQELAVVTLKGGKTRPMTPADIAEMTGLELPDVAHGLAELERAGLAERRDDDGKGLRKGHVRIYCFAIPREVDESKIVGARSNNNFPAWVRSRPKEDPLRRFLNREKATFEANFVVARCNIEAAEAAARAMKEAEMVVRAALESCGARFPLIRKKQPDTTETTDTGGRTVSSIREGNVSTAGLTVRPPAPSPLRETLKTWLIETHGQHIPSALDDAMLDRIAKHIPDAAALEQFQERARNKVMKKWPGYLSIAIDCEEKRKQQPKAAGSRPKAKTAEERAAEELATYLMDLDNPDLSEAQHEEARQKIAAAPAAIAAQARRLYDAMKPRVAAAAE